MKKRIINIISILAFLGLLVACKTPQPIKETVERKIIVSDTIIKVLPPPISGSGYGQTLIIPNPIYSKNDTVVKYIKVKKSDTVVNIRYYPTNNIFQYDIQPDELAVTAKNTIQTETKKEVYKEKVSFWQQIKLAVIGAVILIVLYFIAKFLIKNYWRIK